MAGFRKQGANSIQEILPVFVAPEYGATFDATDHHMLQSTSSDYPKFPWHDPVITNVPLQYQVNTWILHHFDEIPCKKFFARLISHMHSIG
jgi:hypothetical protein